MTVIEIAPAEVGWMLRSYILDGALLFKSGASAESAAIRLAQGMAEAGEDAQVDIYLRDGALGARFTVPALTKLREAAYG